MAVGTYTYGTVAGVHDNVGWVVASRAAFDATTTPTEAEVEKYLNDVASDIHAALVEAGYPADTKANVTTNAARAVVWLAALNEMGAAARILQMFPIANNPETGESPAAYWKGQYEDGKKLIKGSFLSKMGMSKTWETSDHLVATSIRDEDGNEKEPFFKRDTFDYPSSRTLDNSNDD